MGYRIELRDGPRVRHGTTVISKFRTHKAAALLAYLALHPGTHSRDKLLELFWPELELDAARHSLSMALGHLRGPLEKELGQPPGALIQATRDTIGLNAAAYTTDFESLPAGFDPEQLLPGFYDDWVLVAREKLLKSLPTLTTMEPLPAPLTPYQGREELRGRIRGMLAGTRLLTLVGTGGVGKTRLALETLSTHQHQGQTVAWVELSSLSDPAGITDRIVLALGLKSASELLSTLRRTPLLLGLDNCEHLITGAAKEAERLLRACPRLTILATSREPLGLIGETLVRVPGLTERESGALFHERANRVSPGWEVTREQRPLLALLCLRLDGLPLALELAAAKLRTLSLSELVVRLEERLSVLTGGNYVAEPRQQTMYTLIDWSFNLLSVREKALFCRLAIFAGGWTQEAVEQVCAEEEAPASAVREVLASLVDKSLVVYENRDGQERYWLLETVRQYVLERLQETGETDLLSERHLTYFLALAEKAELQLKGPEPVGWLQRVEDELDNVRAGLEKSLTEPEPVRALRLCAAMTLFWWTRGLFSEGRQWCSRALERQGAPEHAKERGNVLNAIGVLAHSQGDYAAARAYQEEGLALRRTIGDREGMSKSLGNLGSVALAQGDYVAACAYQEESLALKQALGDRRGIGNSLNTLGNIAHSQGDFAAAQAYYAQSLILQRELGNRSGIAYALDNLGLGAWLQGNYTPAKAYIKESLALRRELQEKRTMANSLNTLGVIAADQGDYSLARTYHQESLMLRLETGDKLGIAYSLEGVASLIAHEHNHAPAAVLWAAAEALRQGLHSPLPPYLQAVQNRELTQTRRVLSEVVFEAHWSEGLALPLEQALVRVQEHVALVK
jgi:predicted ATPase/Tfp pilus assembly protein PilF